MPSWQIKNEEQGIIAGKSTDSPGLPEKEGNWMKRQVDGSIVYDGRQSDEGFEMKGKGEATKALRH